MENKSMENMARQKENKGREKEGGRMKEEGGRMKEEGGRMKEEGGRMKEEGGKGKDNWRSFRFELQRKLVHIIMGLIIIIGAFYSKTITSWILLVLLFILFVFSLLVLKFNLKSLNFVLESFERGEYRKKFPFKGSIFFLAGCLLVLKLFSLDIALASIAILAFGDSVSHLAGRFGKIKNPLDPKKSFEGLVLGIAVSTITATIFVSFLEAFVASLFAMLAESISIKLQEEEVDDNIIIPLVAGTAIFLIRSF